MSTKEFKDLLQKLLDSWDMEVQQIMLYNLQIRSLEVKRNSQLKILEDLLIQLRQFRDSGKAKALGVAIPPDIDIPLSVRFALGEPTLGDAVEELLVKHGSLSQKELIQLLREAGVRMSAKNPHTVLANIVSRDKRKRFRRLKERRVALAVKKGKQADAKS